MHRFQNPPGGVPRQGEGPQTGGRCQNREGAANPSIYNPLNILEYTSEPLALMD